jgi:hypothetical protein
VWSLRRAVLTHLFPKDVLTILYFYSEAVAFFS